MKIKGKKGADVFSILITIIGIIALTFVMIMILTNQIKIEKQLGKIGDDAVLIFETYHQLDTALVYLDVSAKRSLESAVYCMIKTGFATSCPGDPAKWSDAQDSPDEPEAICDQDPQVSYSDDDYIIDIIDKKGYDFDLSRLQTKFKEELSGKIDSYNKKIPQPSTTPSEQEYGISLPSANDYTYVFERDPYFSAQGKSNNLYEIKRQTKEPKLGEFTYKPTLSFKESVRIPDIKNDQAELKCVVEELIKQIKGKKLDNPQLSMQERVQDLRFNEDDDDELDKDCKKESRSEEEGFDLKLKWKATGPYHSSNRCAAPFPSSDPDNAACKIRVKETKLDENNNVETHPITKEPLMQWNFYDGRKYNHYNSYDSEFSVKILVQREEYPLLDPSLDPPLPPLCTFYKKVPDEIIATTDPVDPPDLDYPTHPDYPDYPTDPVLFDCSDPSEFPDHANDYEYKFKMHWKTSSNTRSCCGNDRNGNFVCQ